MGTNSYSGFTLIELVVVLLLVGALAAVAVPVLIDMRASAHHASVAGTGAAVHSAVNLVKIRYFTNGLSGAQDNIQGFGANDVDVNTAGYPTDTSGANVIGGTAARCMRVWNGILAGPPSIGTAAATTADYRATAAGEVCTFTYRKDGTNTRIITYTASTGTVIVTNP